MQSSESERIYISCLSIPSMYCLEIICKFSNWVSFQNPWNLFEKIIMNFIILLEKANRFIKKN